MVDHAFAEPALTAWYDVLNPWGAGDDFYLGLALPGTAVLDVGCGTGRLLHRARDSGHSGRLCGLDPASAMLAHAQRRADIEWVLGDLGSRSWDREFDLAVMTGHAFQVLLSDDDIAAAFTTVHKALTGGGRFAFETRNPLARPWRRWTPENAIEVTNAAGDQLRVEHRVEEPVGGDVVRFSETFVLPGHNRPQVSHTSLRFLDPAALSSVLSAAGFAVEAQFGDWDRSTLTPSSPEIITIARAVS
ncbi:class I SAM-dependent methyltransferase [Saccharomonospora sp. NPDC046836]|uniref:class I SAM-dependent methyltransferase n=1 Tax=Saccharomonospora sp. NPDC046836 TaxID=3156921 RepID=UPI0033C026E1